MVLVLSVDVLHQARRQYLFATICAICSDILFDLVFCIQAKTFMCNGLGSLSPFGSKEILKQHRLS